MSRPRRRVLAAVALLLGAAGTAYLLVTVIRNLPWGPVTAGIVLLAALAAREGVCRRGTGRILGLGAAVVLLVLAVASAFAGERVLDVVLSVALLVAAVAAARRALAARASLDTAPRPSHPVVVMNLRSGGGKAITHRLADEARARGIEPVEFTPGDDLVGLVRGAVGAGADALAAAGGDGTQALVASIAAELGLPFACIPAGTRNHLALDLGVDRDDVVGALDAFVTGGERRVDLAEVNGQVFVNNVSLGLYAQAVQRAGYRSAKLRTVLDTAPDVVGPDDAHRPDLAWVDPEGLAHPSAALILVSNNAYRLGRVIGSGTRPRLDSGRLGVAVLGSRADTVGGSGRSRRWRQWQPETFRIDSSGPVAAGVDGEAHLLDPPVRFAVRPGALRVRIAMQHPGASPSAELPGSIAGTIGLLCRLAAGLDPAVTGR